MWFPVQLSQSHVDEVLRELASVAIVLEAQGSEALLRRVEEVWDAASRSMLHVRQICLHLDRSYVMHLAPTTGVTSLYDMGLRLLQTGLDAREQVGTCSNSCRQLRARKTGCGCLCRGLGITAQYIALCQTQL